MAEDRYDWNYVNGHGIFIYDKDLSHVTPIMQMMGDDQESMAEEITIALNAQEKENVRDTES